MFYVEPASCFDWYQAIFRQSNTREHMYKFKVTVKSTACVCLCTGCCNVRYSSCLQFLVSPVLVSVYMNAKLIKNMFNSVNTEINPICHLLALLGAHHILHVGRIRVMWSVVIDIHICGRRSQGFDYLSKHVWDIIGHFCLKFHPIMTGCQVHFVSECYSVFTSEVEWQS